MKKKLKHPTMYLESLKNYIVIYFELRTTIVLYVVKCSCSRPPDGVLGITPPTNVHICSRKCLLVLEYFIDITQLYLVSQPEAVISAKAIFMI